MPLPNIFTKEVAEGVIARINKLTPDSQPQWGKMSVDKMLAHCSVAYETIYEPGKHPAPNLVMGLILKLFVKPIVTGEKPLRKNSPTAPYFIISTDRDFTAEKARLIAFIRQTQQLGEREFDGKASLSMGTLSKTQWNNMMYKHLDHHLTQFGV
ncbi:MAG: DUF1569 domain-containing protein [Blastocatellia bacterium]